MYDITTIGTAAIDTFLELEHVVHHKDKKTGIPCYGLPIGQKVPIKKLEEHFGGNALNTALGFKLLKLAPAIVTSLGECLMCKAVCNHLKKHNITTKFISISKTAAINRAYILDWHKDKSNRVILSHHQPKNFKNLRFPKTRWLYLTSLGRYYKNVWGQLPQAPKLIFNPGGYEIQQGVEKLLPILKKTTILIMNHFEAAALLNLDAKKATIPFLLPQLLKLGVEHAVITAGKKGAYAAELRSTKISFVRGITREKLQEVTGAGDAFSSGFIAGYIKHKNSEQALRWGVLNATACIKKIGAQNGLLTFRNLRTEYRKHYK